MSIAPGGVTKWDRSTVQARATHMLNKAHEDAIETAI
jgi:hypothetical protein